MFTFETTLHCDADGCDEYLVGEVKETADEAEAELWRYAAEKDWSMHWGKFKCSKCREVIHERN